jgi:predicted RNase H-like HicB family nuclease
MNDYWMDLPDPPTHAQRWRGFEETEKNTANALEACHEMSLAAEEDENYTYKCIEGEKVFYYDWPRGLMPGHIYSETGMDEFRISRACEFHFDEWFKEEEE